MKESTMSEAEERRREDLREVKTLVGKVVHVDDGDISEPVRLGKMGGNKPRMLKVTVGSEVKRKEILRKASQVNAGVKDAKERVHINPDLTNKERERTGH